MKKILLSILVLVSVYAYSQQKDHKGKYRYDSLYASLAQHGIDTTAFKLVAQRVSDGKFFRTYWPTFGSSGMTNPMTTTGDIIYGGASGTPTRLAAGTNGHVLTLAGGVPSWAAPNGVSGIDDVLAVGQTLTANRTINTGTNGLTIASSSTSTSSMDFTNSSTGGGVNIVTNGGTPLSTQGNSVAGLFVTVPASTNTIAEVTRFSRHSSGTAANGIGGSLNFYTKTSSGGTELTDKLAWKLTDVTSASKSSQIELQSSFNGSAPATVFTAAGEGWTKQVGISATAASAITPTDGMRIYVTSTNGTFTSVGFWNYENGGWVKVGTGTGGSMTYPGAGIPVSDGSAWLTSKAAPTGTIVGTTDAQALTNKRITKRDGSTASSATPTINTDNVDIFRITAQTVDITSMSTNLSGTPSVGDELDIWITGTASRAITWGASFSATLIALPTTTSGTATLKVKFTYNGSTWAIDGYR